MTDRERVRGDRTDQPLFPQERTFVLRFDRSANLRAGKCTGRLEEVSSGGRHSFADLAGLIDHLRKLID